MKTSQRCVPIVMCVLLLTAAATAVAAPADATPSPSTPSSSAAPSIITSPGAVLKLSETTPLTIAGDPAAFHVVVTNTGTAATPVVLTIDWNDQRGGGDASMEDVTATGPHADGCGFNELAGVANCDLGVLAAGTSTQITISGVGIDLDGARTASNVFLTSLNDTLEEFGGWSVDAIPAKTPTGAVQRIAGTNRYSTSVELARSTYPTTAKVVFVATGAAFPDALSAGPAAAHEGGPLLLTARATLPSAVADELTALHPTRVVIVGGTDAVTSAVETEIRRDVPAAGVDRIAGVNRYDTNRRVIADAFPNGTQGAPVWIATGSTYPDALSAATAAGKTGSALVLVPGGASTVDTATSATLADLGASSADIAGGLAAVSNGIQIGLEQRYSADHVWRAAGANRFVTSHLIGGSELTYGSSIGQVYIATGATFPDALAASAIAGAAGKPLLLAQPRCVPAAVRYTVNSGSPSIITLVGGTASLSDSVADFVDC